MGLFSFLKNSGAKILTKKNAKTVAANPEVKRMEEEILNKQKEILLKGIVDGMGKKVKNMELDYDGSTATIHGQVATQSDREKIILALGNVSGVAQVDDRLSVKKKEPEAEFYTVKRGDTLGKIAKRYYGDPMKYKIIFEANKPMLKDPNLIYSGQVLRIPPAKK